jgi:hypothetical protein
MVSKHSLRYDNNNKGLRSTELQSLVKNCHRIRSCPYTGMTIFLLHSILFLHLTFDSISDTLNKAPRYDHTVTDWFYRCFEALSLGVSFPACDVLGTSELQQCVVTSPCRFLDRLTTRHSVWHVLTFWAVELVML